MGFLFPLDEGARSRRDRILAVLFAVVLSVLIGRAVLHAGGVLVRNQEFGERFLALDDPYFDPDRGSRVHGPYPPSFALVAAPLSLFSTPLARTVWALAQAASLVYGFFVLRRWTRRFWPELVREAPLIYAAALLLGSRFILRDMAGGGGNLLYASLAMCAVDLYLGGNRWRAGFPLALSLVLKPNLAPMLLFFLPRRRWTTLFSAMAFAAGLFLLPSAWFGLAGYVGLGERWARDAIVFASAGDPRAVGAVPEGMPAADTSMNQSLPAALNRLVRLDPSGGEEASEREASSARIAAWTARILALALLASAFQVARQAQDGRQELLALLACLPLCMLLSPITWKAHHAALLPLYFALVCEASRTRHMSGLAIFLVAYYIACDLCSQEVVGKAAKEFFQSVSIMTWADVGLFTAVINLCWRSAAVRGEHMPSRATTGERERTRRLEREAEALT